MKLSQFLLLKLSEECAEVSQRASKQIQFGTNQSQSSDGISLQKVSAPNKQRLREEIIDMMSIVRALIMMEEIDPITAQDIYEGYEAKIIKIGKYLQYSIDIGEITIDD